MLRFFSKSGIKSCVKSVYSESH